MCESGTFGSERRLDARVRGGEGKGRDGEERVGVKGDGEERGGVKVDGEERGRVKDGEGNRACWRMRNERRIRVRAIVRFAVPHP